MQGLRHVCQHLFTNKKNNMRLLKWLVLNVLAASTIIFLGLVKFFVEEASQPDAIAGTELVLWALAIITLMAVVALVYIFHLILKSNWDK